MEGFGCICAGDRGDGVVVMDELDEVGQYLQDMLELWLELELGGIGGIGVDFEEELGGFVVGYGVDVDDPDGFPSESAWIYKI